MDAVASAWQHKILIYSHQWRVHCPVSTVSWSNYSGNKPKTKKKSITNELEWISYDDAFDHIEDIFLATYAPGGSHWLIFNGPNYYYWFGWSLKHTQHSNFFDMEFHRTIQLHLVRATSNATSNEFDSLLCRSSLPFTTCVCAVCTRSLMCISMSLSSTAHCHWYQRTNATIWRLSRVRALAHECELTFSLNFTRARAFI